jgi:hypothetical protein
LDGCFVLFYFQPFLQLIARQGLLFGEEAAVGNQLQQSCSLLCLTDLPAATYTHTHQSA